MLLRKLFVNVIHRINNKPKMHLPTDAEKQAGLIQATIVLSKTNQEQSFLTPQAIVNSFPAAVTKINIFFPSRKGFRTENSYVKVRARRSTTLGRIICTVTGQTRRGSVLESLQQNSCAHKRGEDKLRRGNIDLETQIAYLTEHCFGMIRIQRTVK